MTATRRDGDGGGLPGGSATARGVILIVAAVVVGLLLLGKGFDSGFLPSTGDDDTDVASDDGGDDGGEETDNTTSNTVATPVTHAVADVRVQVLNGGGPSGSAAAATTTLRTAGFTTSDAADTGDVPGTTILYAEGFQADAQVVAATINTTVAPQPMGATPPTPVAPGAIDVVIVLGPDYTG